jgi:ADP-ribosylglycohydrolase
VFGCDVAALTHGHPTGYLAAGAFALMISAVVTGESLGDATSAAIDRLRQDPASTEVVEALEKAVAMAATTEPCPETVAQLGEGKVAEEALAIGTYCALVAPDFTSGVRLAVNHGGGSDSTGSICGNLLGAAWGVSAISNDFLEPLEGRSVIAQVADDLFDMFVGGSPPSWERYPGW